MAILLTTIGNHFLDITPLMLAVEKKDVDMSRLLIRNGADVNNVSSEGKPAFLLLCEKALDCSIMCLSMLDKGADANATNQV